MRFRDTPTLSSSTQDWASVQKTLLSSFGTMRCGRFCFRPLFDLYLFRKMVNTCVVNEVKCVSHAHKQSNRKKRLRTALADRVSLVHRWIVRGPRSESSKYTVLQLPRVGKSKKKKEGLFRTDKASQSRTFPNPVTDVRTAMNI